MSLQPEDGSVALFNTVILNYNYSIKTIFKMIYRYRIIYKVTLVQLGNRNGHRLQGVLPRGTVLLLTANCIFPCWRKRALERGKGPNGGSALVIVFTGQ